MVPPSPQYPITRRPVLKRTSIHSWRSFIEAQRLRMAHAEAVPQLALMGVVSGLIAGVIIIAFRGVVEAGATALFPMEDAESFENIAPEWRLCIAIAGGLAVGLLFHFARKSTHSVGVVHVIERLNHHQGYLPFRNAALQFAGAALAIISGHSVGREGPSIHLGAASGSLLACRLGLPNNSVRTLVGCGVAAAIAAGFNTPLAGIIFAMEVVLMEYTIIGFVPIILAAVSATALTRLVYGEGAAFFVYAYEWSTLKELLYVMTLGIAIGVLAALFIRLTLFVSTLSGNLSILPRMLIAGALVGLIAVPAPEVMGIGYDTVNAALLGELALATLALVVVAKLVATSACIGLGSPGGLIAPTLFMGASAGGLLGMASTDLFNTDISAGFYSMLGMGAMMAATLQAPLAAIIALMELTANPNFIMPGMTAVISAVLITRVVFRCPSIYQLVMQSRGLDYGNSPVAPALRRIGIASVMNRKFIEQQRKISRDAALSLLQRDLDWVVVWDRQILAALLPISDLARYVEQQADQGEIDLLEIPAQRRDLETTSIIASLQDALELLQRTGKEALCVTGAKASQSNRLYGVVCREDIESSYRG